jgi:hypothetical protein
MIGKRKLNEKNEIKKVAKFDDDRDLFAIGDGKVVDFH